jgi:hypothetical protein
MITHFLRCDDGTPTGKRLSRERFEERLEVWQMKNSQRLTALLAAAALGLIAVIAAQAATARVHEQPAPTAKCASSTAENSARPNVLSLK